MWTITEAIKVDGSSSTGGIYITDGAGGSVHLKAPPSVSGSTITTFVLPDTIGDTGDVALTEVVEGSPSYKLSWASMPSPSEYRMWTFKDVKVTGVSGGAIFAGSWITRELNTSEGIGTDAALLGNDIVLQPGVWSVTVIVPSYNVEYSSSRVQDITHGSTWGYGMPSKSGGLEDTGVSATNIITLIRTVAEETHIEIQQRCTVDNMVDGLGTPTNAIGYDEIYTIVTLTKVG